MSNTKADILVQLRADFLWRAATTAAASSHSLPLARFYLHKLLRLSHTSGVPIPFRIAKHFCSRCGSFFVPGSTCAVRVVSSVKEAKDLILDDNKEKSVRVVVLDPDAGSKMDTKKISFSFTDANENTRSTGEKSGKNVKVAMAGPFNYVCTACFLCGNRQLVPGVSAADVESYEKERTEGRLRNTGENVAAPGVPSKKKKRRREKEEDPIARIKRLAKETQGEKAGAIVEPKLESGPDTKSSTRTQSSEESHLVDLRMQLHAATLEKSGSHKFLNTLTPPQQRREGTKIVTTKELAGNRKKDRKKNELLAMISASKKKKDDSDKNKLDLNDFLSAL
ncbi:hypothetical protein BJ742DRAFT_805262 [Cladochytrium replicatum]|nr:hypothetical protein BJ742DRAFT_805262 [Cladochytrium replicatum]